MNDFTSPRTLKTIAESTVRRLSLYLRFLEEYSSRGFTTISSEVLAQSGETTSAQVRKDLSFFGSFGKRGLGYRVDDLISAIRGIMGLEENWSVVIVGAGKIGAALTRHQGFTTRGFTVAGIYDSDPAKVGTAIDTLTVRADSDLERDISKHGQRVIAVICVPASAAQGIVNRVVGVGVRAVLNFATAPISVPDGVTVRHVNMATELEILAYAVTNR